MVRLLNSAIMPQEGTYRLKKISKEEFRDFLIESYNNNNLKSYVGYQDNINFIYKLTGITIQFSRETTTLDAGDILLIIKLNKRIGDPAMKGKICFNEEDFEFYISYYTPPEE